MTLKVSFTDDTDTELFSHTFTDRETEIFLHGFTMQSLWDIVKNTMLVAGARTKPKLMAEAVNRLERFGVTPDEFTEDGIFRAWLSHPEYMDMEAKRTATRPSPETPLPQNP